jgi:pimeloyl-ACP methyl ester carboxylesterase
MNPHPPYRVSTRDRSTAGKLRNAYPRGNYDPSGSQLLTIFVHGYNNSECRALARWDDHIWPSLQALTNSPIDGVVLFFWPGESHSIKVLSAPEYPGRVQTAIDAGVELGNYLRRIAIYNPGLRVQFVGHSLGCRVVLSAVNQLAEDPQIVPVARVLLMGAAVPMGDCKAPGSWREKVSTLFRTASGWEAVGNSDVVRYSRDDEILGRIFLSGESYARQKGLVSYEPHEAVGLTGGPRARWSGEPDPCGLKHDQYPCHPIALQHVAAMFGPLADRQNADRNMGERYPDEQMPESVPC